MGRVYAPLRVDGRELWTLFDTGAISSYITRDAAVGMPTLRLRVPHRVGLGGAVRTVEEVCHVDGLIEGRPVDFEAYLAETLGKDARGRSIDLLFGALAMQKFHIHLRPDEERLDLSHYPTEFIEYHNSGLG